MLKIAIISLITLILSVIVKQKSPEMSMMINIVGGFVVLTSCFENLSTLINYYADLSSSVNVDSSVFKIALKVLSVGFITEFVSDLASDFGNSSIASKVVFGGKIAICVLTLPVVKELVLLLFSFL